MVWEPWSVHREIRAEPQGVTIRNVQAIGDYTLQPITIPRGFRDTFSLRGGVELKPPIGQGRPLTLRAGLMVEPSAITFAINYKMGGFTADAAPTSMMVASLTWKKAKFHAEAEKATLNQDPPPVSVNAGDPPSKVEFGVTGGSYKVTWPRKGSDPGAAKALSPCQFE